MYLCRLSEASTRYCVIPGGYPPQDWQSFPCAGEELDLNPGLLICRQVRYHWATAPPYWATSPPYWATSPPFPFRVPFRLFRGQPVAKSYPKRPPSGELNVCGVSCGTARCRIRTRDCWTIFAPSHPMIPCCSCTVIFYVGTKIFNLLRSHFTWRVINCWSFVLNL